MTVTVRCQRPSCLESEPCTDCAKDERAMGMAVVSLLEISGNAKITRTAWVPEKSAAKKETQPPESEVESKARREL